MNEAAPAGDTDDTMFGEPYLDLDEWRDGPVRHRYVHGRFGGTETMTRPEQCTWSPAR